MRNSYICCFFNCFWALYVFIRDTVSILCDSLVASAAACMMVGWYIGVRNSLDVVTGPSITVREQR